MVVLVVVLDSSPFVRVFVVVVLDSAFELDGDSFTTVVLFSVLFSAGGLTVVVSLFSQAASKATPAKSTMPFFTGARMLKAVARNQGVAVATGDSAAAGLDVVIASVEVVPLGLAAGAAVSVFCSQAASKAAPARMQIYLFIVVVESPILGY